MENQMFAGRVA